MICIFIIYILWIASQIAFFSKNSFFLHIIHLFLVRDHVLLSVGTEDKKIP